MVFWFRRKDSVGKWWSVYVVRKGHIELLGGRALADYDKRRILVETHGSRRELNSSLLHEWLHVELWAHGIAGHSHDGTPLHRVIEHVARAHEYRGPKKAAPIPEDKWQDDVKRSK